MTRGLPELPGATILERRQALQTHYDHIRTGRGEYNIDPDDPLGQGFLLNQ